MRKLLAVFAVLALLGGATVVSAAGNPNGDPHDKVTVCHTNQDGTQETDTIPSFVLAKAPGHANDTPGACPTPTVAPTETPAPTATPTV